MSNGGDIPYAEMTYRGKIGPATLSKPEPGWATTIPQDLEHETSVGRQVPSPKKQMLEDMLRSEGLRFQARNPDARDKIIRGGAVRGTSRQFGRGLARNRAGGVPSWGESNVRYAGHGTTVKEAALGRGLKTFLGGKIKQFGSAVKSWADTPSTPPPPISPATSSIPGTPPVSPIPSASTQLRPRPMSQPGIGMGQYRMLSNVQGAEPENLIRMAEKRKIPVSGWSKALSNPLANLLIQMGAITAVEPVLSTLGIQHPLFYMMAPWAMMSFLPDYLKKWSGIEKLRGQLTQRAKAGVLGRGPMPAAAPVPDPTTAQAGWQRFMKRMPKK